jgi:hypothetical protein
MKNIIADIPVGTAEETVLQQARQNFLLKHDITTTI